MAVEIRCGGVRKQAPEQPPKPMLNRRGRPGPAVKRDAVVMLPQAHADGPSGHMPAGICQFRWYRGSQPFVLYRDERFLYNIGIKRLIKERGHVC